MVHMMSSNACFLAMFFPCLAKRPTFYTKPTHTHTSNSGHFLLVFVPLCFQKSQAYALHTQAAFFHTLNIWHTHTTMKVWLKHGKTSNILSYGTKIFVHEIWTTGRERNAAGVQLMLQLIVFLNKVVFNSWSQTLKGHAWEEFELNIWTIGLILGQVCFDKTFGYVSMGVQTPVWPNIRVCYTHVTNHVPK